MKWITAYSIVTVEQLEGYTDRTPVIATDFNGLRVYKFRRMMDITFSNLSYNGVNFYSESIALQFSYRQNSN